MEQCFPFLQRRQNDNRCTTLALKQHMCAVTLMPLPFVLFTCFQEILFSMLMAHSDSLFLFREEYCLFA